MKLYKLLLVFIILFSIISCDNEPLVPTRDIEEEVINPNPGPTGIDISETFGTETQRSFLGTVIDVNENPISNVNIRIGNSLASTDDNGVFIINDATVNENFGYITASKFGYIQGSRAVVPTTGTNKVTIMLLEATIVGSTSSGTQATINLPNGASVTLSGDYIKEDGLPYQGNVDVILHHLDPTDPNMENQMPGMLFAANTNNEAQILKSFGMLAIELKGTNGETLNLAENTTAQIIVPVAPELLADAPSTIPLWYFDEEVGYWKEEGEAQLTGNQYIGTVSHFSFWNYDIPIDFIKLCIEVVDENNNPLVNHTVNLTTVNYGTVTSTTNSYGQVCGFVPSGGIFTADLLGYGVCNDQIIYTEALGTLSSDASITIVIPYSPNLISETVTGSFQNCDGQIVSDGYVVLTSSGQQYLDQVVNGNFEVNFLRCLQNDTFSVQAYDYNTYQSTEEINFGFTTPTTNLGVLNACDDVTEFITYQIGNNDPITYFTNINASSLDYAYDPFSTYIRTYQPAPAPLTSYLFSIYLPHQIVGSFDYDSTNSGVRIIIRDANGYDVDIDYLYTITVNVTSHGVVGQYVDINFSGTFGNTEEPISGTVRALW